MCVKCDMTHFDQFLHALELGSLVLVGMNHVLSSPLGPSPPCLRPRVVIHIPYLHTRPCTFYFLGVPITHTWSIKPLSLPSTWDLLHVPYLSRSFHSVALSPIASTFLIFTYSSSSQNTTWGLRLTFPLAPAYLVPFA